MIKDGKRKEPLNQRKGAPRSECSAVTSRSVGCCGRRVARGVQELIACPGVAWDDFDRFNCRDGVDIVTPGGTKLDTCAEIRAFVSDDD